ncbi:hypothetical protein BN126360335 [Stenotrophomonas indicatrix]|nr:hypothetical protein BN126360335 [Stenotrophomonas indicatrix]
MGPAALLHARPTGVSAGVGDPAC